MISFYSIQIYKLDLKHWAFSNTQLRAMIKAVYLCSYFSILHPIVCSILFCQDFKMYFATCVLIRQKMLRNESCIWKKKGSSLPFPYFSKLPYRIFFLAGCFHFGNHLFIQSHRTPFGRFLRVWYCSTHPKRNGFISRAKVRSWEFTINEHSYIIP